MSQRYIMNPKNGMVVPWNAQLAAKKHLVECDAEGNPVAPRIERQTVPEAFLQPEAEHAGNEAALDDALKAIGRLRTKEQMIAYGRQAFEMELDPNMKAKDMIAELENRALNGA